jgi:alpha-glucosidase
MKKGEKMGSPWWQHGIIYQIYPRSFADSNGDGIGDLNGITGRLDYLANLGIDAIWLSPIYPSPDADFGYDISDYCAVDPKFGTLADFDHLLEEAHARGIRIVLDLVLNHTSDQHPWFIESRSSRDNPKRDWYLWGDPSPNGGPPNNWYSVFGGPGWEPDPTTGQSYFHMFYKQQPDVNWRNPQVRQAMLDVFRFWLERGVDGFRLDVFNAYFKHPELANNPVIFPVPIYGFAGQRHVNDIDQPDMIPLLQEIRTLLDSYFTPGRERYAVGETFMGGAEKAAYYSGPDRLHAAFNFDFLHSRWSAHALMDRVQRWEHYLGPDTWPNYVLNNHDVSRTGTRLRRPFADPEDDARLKIAAALLLTLRGTPFIYYGEEIGMRDIPLRSKAEVLDPIGKQFWPLMKGRDGCRAPMQWSAAPNAGFTTPGARPWLPVHADAAQRNVDAQRADPRSLFNTYRRLIALRRAHPVLVEGMFQPVTYGTRFITAYLRQSQDQLVLVVLNFSGRRQRLVLGRHLSQAGWKVLFSTHREEGGSLSQPRRGMVALEPHEALILEPLPVPVAK